MSRCSRKKPAVFLFILQNHVTAHCYLYFSSSFFSFPFFMFFAPSDLYTRFISIFFLHVSSLITSPPLGFSLPSLSLILSIPPLTSSSHATTFNSSPSPPHTFSASLPPSPSLHFDAPSASFLLAHLPLTSSNNNYIFTSLVHFLPFPSVFIFLSPFHKMFPHFPVNNEVADPFCHSPVFHCLLNCLFYIPFSFLSASPIRCFISPSTSS